MGTLPKERTEKKIGKANRHGKLEHHRRIKVKMSLRNVWKWEYDSKVERLRSGRARNRANKDQMAD